MRDLDRVSVEDLRRMRRYDLLTARITLIPKTRDGAKLEGSGERCFVLNLGVDKCATLGMSWLGKQKKVIYDLQTLAMGREVSSL